MNRESQNSKIALLDQTLTKFDGWSNKIKNLLKYQIASYHTQTYLPKHFDDIDQIWLALATLDQKFNQELIQKLNHLVKTNLSSYEKQ